MEKSDIKEMFGSNVHIGHRTRKWNPKMKKFIYGEQNGVHILDLEKTADYMDEAMSFLSKLAFEGKTLLFVSTKPQSVNVLPDAAKKCSMPFVSLKWIPGLLTNFSTLKTRIKYLSDLKEQDEVGGFSKYTKKEASKMKKEMEKLSLALDGVKDMKKVPDAVFVLDTVRDKIVVTEAKKLGLPVVGIVDTNADPDAVDYPIPANDDSLKSIKYILGKTVEAFTKKQAKSKK